MDKTMLVKMKKEFKKPTKKEIEEWTKLYDEDKLKKCPVCGNKDNFEVSKSSYWEECWNSLNEDEYDDDIIAEEIVDDADVDCIRCEQCETKIVDHHIADRLDINWEEFLKLKGGKKDGKDTD
jgi:hypothetical protein